MRVVMTGATSGIGLAAARLLLERPEAKLLTGSRSAEGSRGVLPGATIVPLDLASLASTRGFAEHAAEAPIDLLILNAGLQVTSRKSSADGFEITFAANHLAHFLLLHLLLPRLAPGARVILTGSGTHDPALKTPVPAPNHADAERLAYPDRDPQRDRNVGKACRRAYAASKLCNIMTARELARRTAVSRPDLMIAAFDPAYVPATGLARDYPAPVRWIAAHVVSRLVGSGHVSTPEISGRHLADLATGARYAGSRGDYWSVVDRKMVPFQPSVLARDDGACAKLWDDSIRLVELEPVG
jgi:NAD(P)-dependent dehydrogenase (short-subunit alcohol dehydrogenase family)